MPEPERQTGYYALLGIKPSASVQEIRRAYRELSKLYHPDTTELPPAIATAKFQELNEAYGTLSSPEKRYSYDIRNGYSRLSVIQAPPDLNRPVSRSSPRSSAYLDPVDRTLSPGELFALFILGVTFVACLILVVAVGLTRGDRVLLPLTATVPTPPSIEQVVPVESRATAIDSAIEMKTATEMKAEAAIENAARSEPTSDASNSSVVESAAPAAPSPAD